MPMHHHSQKIQRFLKLHTESKMFILTCDTVIIDKTIFVRYKYLDSMPRNWRYSAALRAHFYPAVLTRDICRVVAEA